MGTCVYVLLTQSYDNNVCDYKQILPLGYMHRYYQTSNKDVQLTCYLELSLKVFILPTRSY